jgi:trans-2,3-dihydro-3-hydroxyanthranilate isomerase
MLKSLKAIRAIRVDWNAVADYFAQGDKARSFYFLTPETESDARFHARKLTPRTEDPVTGSAAGSAIAWLVAHKLVGSGEQIVIEQGAEVQRSGKLYVAADLAGTTATNVKVGGYAVKTWIGELPVRP